MRAAAGGLLLACACNYAAAFVPPTLTFNLRRSAHAPAVQSQAAGRSPKCGTITRTLRCEHRSVHIAQPKEKVSGKDSFW